MLRCVVLVFLLSTTNPYDISILFRTDSSVHRILFAMSAHSFVRSTWIDSSLCFLSILLKLFLPPGCPFPLPHPPNMRSDWGFFYCLNLYFCLFYFLRRWRCSSFWRVLPEHFSFEVYCFVAGCFFLILPPCCYCCCCFIVLIDSLSWWSSWQTNGLLKGLFFNKYWI